MALDDYIKRHIWMSVFDTTNFTLFFQISEKHDVLRSCK